MHASFCKRPLNCFAAVLVGTFLFAGSTYAFTTVVDTAGGLEDDSYATGRLIDVNSSSSTVATWTLDTTVSGTDFSNDAITGGPDGLEYVTTNLTQQSSDSNSIRYSITPEVGYSLQNIVIGQSPYNDSAGSWNGGNAEAAQFVISWANGGFANVTDPDDQLFGFVSGTPIVSGTTVRYNSIQAFNSEDSWRISLPAGVDTVQLNWSSANPTPNSDLTREWVSFDANIAAVPEPSTMAILGMLLLPGFLVIRKFKS